MTGRVLFQSSDKESGTFSLIHPDKLIQIGLLIQLQTFFQAALRLGEGIGRVIENSHLIFAGKVPFYQATDFLFMTGYTRFLLHLRQEVIEKKVGRTKQFHPFLPAEISAYRILFELQQQGKGIDRQLYRF